MRMGVFTGHGSVLIMPHVDAHYIGLDHSVWELLEGIANEIK